MPEAVVEKPKYQIPKSGMNPHIAPNLVCVARGCHEILKPKSAKEDPSTGQLMVYYECPNCGYGFHLSPEYAHGAYCAPGQAPKKLPEVLQAGK